MFGLRNKFGTHRQKESTKAKKKRLQATGKLPRRKEKKKKQVIRELFQSYFTEDGGIIHNDAESFADALVPTKPPQTFGCASHNIGLLPESAHHQKSRRLINHIRESQFDVLLMQEVGLYWSKLDPSDQWVERVRTLPDSTSIFAHNTLELQVSSSSQYGGVGIFAASEVRHCMVERGKDPSGLGRWA